MKPLKALGKQDKNRYVEILPFDFNRVLLHRDSTDHEDWGYINASLVSSKAEDFPEWNYIVTQVLHFPDYCSSCQHIIYMLDDVAQALLKRRYPDLC